MTHIVQVIEDFSDFLSMAKSGFMHLIKYERHPEVTDCYILTIGRHDRACIFLHYLEDCEAQDAEDLIYIAGFKSSPGQWTIENSPSTPLDTHGTACKMPANVP